MFNPREEAQDYYFTLSRLLAFLSVLPGAFGEAGFLAVLSFNSESLADLAMRGWAISFLTLAFVAFSISLSFFLPKIQP